MSERLPEPGTRCRVTVNFAFEGEFVGVTTDRRGVEHARFKTDSGPTTFSSSPFREVPLEHARIREQG